MARQRQQAAAFLERVLGAGPLPSQQAWEQAWQAGYSRRTYDRARKALKVQARRRGWGGMSRWVLSLPPAKALLFPGRVDSEHSAHGAELEHGAKHAVQLYQWRTQA